MASRRRLARIAVLQTLFETDFRVGTAKDTSAKILERNIAEAEGLVDTTFAQVLLQGVQTHRENILTAMRENAPEWPVERMDRMTRCILMIGTFELLHNTEVPPPVVMNEAIDIAKEFGGSEGAKFVNGVLNAIFQHAVDSSAA